MLHKTRFDKFAMDDRRSCRSVTLTIKQFLIQSLHEAVTSVVRCIVPERRKRRISPFLSLDVVKGRLRSDGDRLTTCHVCSIAHRYVILGNWVSRLRSTWDGYIFKDGDNPWGCIYQVTISFYFYLLNCLCFAWITWYN
jgi:hypothetical protein